MNTQDTLAAQFEAHRTHLRVVAYRMLGSQAEADDAVQEAWLRLSRSDTSGVANLGGWLTTTVSRICLDMLRSRTSRREEPINPEAPEPMVSPEAGGDPEYEALLADSVGIALQVVLDTLRPGERIAFVLHDIFDVPFEEIAPIVGCTPTAARQLASRARRQVRGTATMPDADIPQQQEVVSAFLAAARAGDFGALLNLLDPEVTLRTDLTTARTFAGPELRGAEAVAKQFVGRPMGAKVWLVNGAVGLVWAPGGQTRGVIGFTLHEGKIVAIGIVTEPERLRQLDLAELGG